MNSLLGKGFMLTSTGVTLFMLAYTSMQVMPSRSGPRIELKNLEQIVTSVDSVS